MHCCWSLHFVFCRKSTDRILWTFSFAGLKLASNIKHSEKGYFKYLSNPTQKTLFIKPIVADEVVKIISKLNQNKNPGHDGIGNLIVKKVASIISKPLTDIFNLSLSMSGGSVPEQLKLAKVLRLYPIILKKRILKYSQITVLLLFKNITKTGF